MKIDKRKYNGGARPGSGRPKAPYKTVTISWRIREGWVKPVNEVVRKELERLRGGV